ncbi:MAG: glycosyltransferase family 2 protein [Desulfuromonadaceae bacterium]|nr:glycosyltransferase family 2 protein [Desulfuromonadaceae bacterium]MDD2855339.1 glycosyltransferase family 2 protein [Desulfuromonadaceae bacterium]
MDTNGNGETALKQIAIDQISHSVVFTANSNRFPPHEKCCLDLTIFIACYNEAENIIGTLETVAEAMSKLDFSWEVIVIDDASTDNSVELVKQYMLRFQHLPLLLVALEENQGLAQNFIEAAFLGRGKYYRLINGDNVESSCQIANILSHIGEADILIPYHAEVSGRTLFRRYLSKLYTFVVNILSGYNIKYYNACSVHLRYDVMRWHVNCTGFDFQANLITRLLGIGRSHLEIPAVGSERPFGESKALTARNFFSAARFFMDLAFRRVWKMLH